MSSAPSTTTHVLVFPYPAQGHILSLLNLTHYLALRDLKITILVTPKNLPALNTLLSAHPNSIQPFVLPFPPHPKLPSGVEHIKDVGNSGNAPVIASLAKLEGEIIQWFHSHPCPPQTILSDFFLGWTQNLAEKLNIPRIAFFPSRAIMNCVLTQLMQNTDSVRTLEIVEFPDIPTSPSLPQKQLPSIFRKYQKGDSDWEIVRESLLANSKSWGIVIDSFYALEGESLDHLKKKLGHERVYGVGPLYLIGRKAEIFKSENPDSETKSPVLNWLDKWEEKSVLYVCFGSQKTLSKPLMEALALSLERSKARFVWVVKSIDRDLEEFEERVRDQGLVVRGYAPQVEILNHKAVGGFVSHCGWNSLLEGLVAGVLFLAWPMEADQYTNARLLVEDLQLGVPLWEGEDRVPNPDELARTISDSICGSLPQRMRAKEMSERALEAVIAGGSSAMDLDEFVKLLRQIKVRKV